MSVILVVDDEPSILSSLDRSLSQTGHTVLTASSGKDALAVAGARGPDVVLMDVQMDGLSGLDTLPQLKQVLPGAPVILMTGFGTMDTAIEAMKRGAFDYLVKPLHAADLHGLITKAVSTLGLARRPPAPAVAPEGLPAAGLVGRSPQMIEVCKTVGQASRSDVTVLVRGESGTGKELVARALHAFSPRARQPFVTVNCAAIPETLLESELFGYERGAFTGAVARRSGRFEQADKGTIFLDEVGDMAPGTQAKVLRILQDRTLERLGGSETLRLDVRVLAATNRNLEQLVARGVFREDLYYRLKVLSIDLPALRERKEDIPDLARAFLQQPGAHAGGHVPSLSPAALQRLMSHDWPGNVRELKSCLEQAVVVCRNGVILPEHLRLEAAPADGETQIRDKARETLRSMSRQALADAPGRAYDELIQEAERQVIAEALRRTRGNLVHASRLLGVCRPTLRLKVNRYGLKRGEGEAEAPTRARRSELRDKSASDAESVSDQEP